MFRPIYLILARNSRILDRGVLTFKDRDPQLSMWIVQYKKRRHSVDLFMHVVRSLDSSPLSIIWIVLLIDCFVNRELKGPQKVWWILFIFITQFFGALLYFFLGPAQIYRHIVNKMNQPYHVLTPPTLLSQV